MWCAQESSSDQRCNVCADPALSLSQVADAMRRDERLVVMEGVNLRYLTAADLPARPSLVTLDLSFISVGRK